LSVTVPDVYRQGPGVAAVPGVVVTTLATAFPFAWVAAVLPLWARVTVGVTGLTVAGAAVTSICSVPTRMMSLTCTGSVPAANLIGKLV
jgi:hypothetical protein